MKDIICWPVDDDEHGAEDKKHRTGGDNVFLCESVEHLGRQMASDEHIPRDVQLFWTLGAAYSSSALLRAGRRYNMVEFISTQHLKSAIIEILGSLGR